MGARVLLDSYGDGDQCDQASVADQLSRGAVMREERWL